MAAYTGIEWTQATWNPVTGCTKIAAGCVNCYAERMANRLKAMGNPRYTNGFRPTMHPDLLALPLRWRQPRTIFVNSMSDLFHEAVPLEFIKDVFRTIETADWHTFQILTKRASRLSALAGDLRWPANLWMGVTIERQDYAWRADHLRRVPCAVRFLSCEPLLGPLDLDLEGIDWVIVGGESGPGARPMELDWSRRLRDQCLRAEVPIFLKQLGGAVDKRGRDKAVLDGRRWTEKPCLPTIQGFGRS
ncbi:MAG: DUF5131 family protein [Chloroflexota bacterium]